MTITSEASFYVAGYSVRTNNSYEISGQSRIGKLWENFQQQKVGSMIPHRVDQRLVVVYSDYSSDEKGDYTYLLGAPVSSIQDLPAEMSYRKLVPGRYSVLNTRTGPLVQVLQEEWKRIWSMSSAELGGQRAFLTDYEVYDQRSVDPQKAQIEIHIGLK